MNAGMQGPSKVSQRYISKSKVPARANRGSWSDRQLRSTPHSKSSGALSHERQLVRSGGPLAAQMMAPPPFRARFWAMVQLVSVGTALLAVNTPPPLFRDRFPAMMQSVSSRNEFPAAISPPPFVAEFPMMRQRLICGEESLHDTPPSEF